RAAPTPAAHAPAGQLLAWSPARPLRCCSRRFLLDLWRITPHAASGNGRGGGTAVLQSSTRYGTTSIGWSARLSGGEWLRALGRTLSPDRANQPAQHSVATTRSRSLAACRVPARRAAARCLWCRRPRAPARSATDSRAPLGAGRRA